MKLKAISFLVLLLIGLSANGENSNQNPVEVGDVNWGRDYNAALKTSAKSGKPVLVLFQEVPG